MDRTIQVFKPKFRTEEVLAEIRECLDRGWTGIGFKTEQFEQEWKAYSGFEYAHFVNSATAGLHLAFNLLKNELGWADGDEVISTALTFVSTNHAILYERLTPVFADVDASMCLDPDSVEAAITGKTRAVIYVGIGGNAANYREIRDLCKRKNLLFILDAAHMGGTRWKADNTHVGLDADCTIFSYQAVKNCPSADSGMICFREKRYDEKVRRLSWLGIDKSTYSRHSESFYKWKYDVTDLGFKYHGNSIVASMCKVSLKYLDQDNEYRRALACHYDELLTDIKEVTIVRHSDDVLSSRHLYQIMLNDRDGFIDYLAAKGVFCGVHYLINTAYGVYKSYPNYAVKAAAFADRLVSLPLHMELTTDDATEIVTIIKGWAAQD